MGLAGNLRDLTITNIIELHCTERSSVQLTVQTRSGDAMVFFDHGDIVHARWGELKGTKALYHILRLTDGEFRVTSGIAPPERTIFESWKGLVLDGMRVYDETRRIQDSIAHSLADELRDLRGVSRLLVVAKDGTLVQKRAIPTPSARSPSARCSPPRAPGLATRSISGRSITPPTCAARRRSSSSTSTSSSCCSPCRARPISGRRAR
jgi:hypothetical protein